LLFGPIGGDEMRKVLLVAVSVLAIVLSPGVAGAGKPQVQTFHAEGSDLEIEQCEDFTILLDFSHDTTITTYTDKDGSPVRSHISFQFVGTFSNPESGKSVYESGTYSVFVDLSTGEARVVGLVLLMRAPGQGVVLLELGQVQLDEGGNATLSGRPSAVEGASLLCSLLA
jgi:hypothetical protein